MSNRTDLQRASRAALASELSFVTSQGRVGSATLYRVAEAPASPMLNRVVGLGIDAPATAADVDRIAAEMAGLRHYVAVAPGAAPSELTTWLSARGYQPGWGWMQFTRGVDELKVRPSDLAVAPVQADEAPAFAAIVSSSFGLPAAVMPILEGVCRHPGWTCVVAKAGAVVVGAAAVFVHEGVGYLGFAATHPDHRGRGAQSSLLAARIRIARERGCDLLTTETGERIPDKPSNSYRNILRAGFVEEHVVANWIGGTPPAAPA